MMKIVKAVVSVLIPAQTDIDSDEGEHSETEHSDVSQVQNSSVNEISDLFTSRIRSGRVAGSWRPGEKVPR